MGHTTVDQVAVRPAPLDVLVVCTANVARSPLAAAMLTNGPMSRAAHVHSAGVHAHDGDPAAAGTQRLARRRGLDLSAHRSRPVSGRLLSGADLVLTMSERQRDHCASVSAGLGSRTFTLREFVRLIAALDGDDGPSEAADRIRWLRDQAHFARPRSARPRDREDVADPIRQGPSAWRRLGRDLDELVGAIERRLSARV